MLFSEESLEYFLFFDELCNLKNWTLRLIWKGLQEEEVKAWEIFEVLVKG